LSDLFAPLAHSFDVSNNLPEFNRAYLLNMAAKREVDAVVLGATGFTGSRVLKCIVSKKTAWYIARVPDANLGISNHIFCLRAFFFSIYLCCPLHALFPQNMQQILCTATVLQLHVTSIFV
jgi:hypothetical protein